MDRPLYELQRGPEPSPPPIEPLHIAPARAQHLDAVSLSIIHLFVSLLQTTEVAVLAEAHGEAGKESAPELEACVVHAGVTALPASFLVLFDYFCSFAHVHEFIFIFFFFLISFFFFSNKIVFLFLFDDLRFLL